ncbi:MAG: MvdC/MvdD family ATP grasp protein [bacterium]
MLLVISNRTDLATDYLILKLKEKSIPFIRLNTEQYGKEYQINLFLDNKNYNFKINFKNEKKISNKDIKAVYFRQPRLPEMDFFNVSKKDADFAEREISETFRSLWRSINKNKWLNHPENLWLATNKVKQLRLAADIDFNIPNTCISTSKEVIKDFFKKNRKEMILVF